MSTYRLKYKSGNNPANFFAEIKIVLYAHITKAYGPLLEIICERIEDGLELFPSRNEKNPKKRYTSNQTLLNTLQLVELKSLTNKSVAEKAMNILINFKEDQTQDFSASLRQKILDDYGDIADIVTNEDETVM